MKILIPIHSFVNLITNSSSELFVSATEATVKTIKEVLQAFLDAAECGLTVDDVWTVKLVYEDYDNNDKKVLKEGTSEYRPSQILVELKPGYHPKLATIATVMNKLNGAFEGIEFMN